MPLPPNGTPWPPTQLATITPKLTQWDAWYVGDPDGLRSAYLPGTSRPRPAQYAGGLQGKLARLWWGRPVTDPTQQRGQLHVPIAADVCQTSADLLFAEPPTVEHPDTKTQDRLTELLDDNAHSALAESAEIAAALSGDFLRVTWDHDINPDGPFLTSVHMDSAVPEFRWGRLVAVTFWHQVKVEGSTIWRHLERHELAPNGNGVILHGLYQGTAVDLGHVVPLADVDATAGLADVVDDQSMIDTGSPGLAVVYIANQRPQRTWRKDPLGQHLGRSDLDGIEPLMDSLDETYSSWMRDIRLGKARVIVARSLLHDRGAGLGAAFDLDEEVFAPVNALAGAKGEGGLPITPVQFAIRVDEHARTAKQLVEDILRTAGYSSQTFDAGIQDANLTATEVNAREQRSLMTRDRKVRLWRPAIIAVMGKLLAVDREFFGHPNQADVLPDVTFPDTVQDSVLTLAQTANALTSARAASTRTKVQMVHPDWPDDEVDKEVALIHAEESVGVPDPTSPTVAAGTDPMAGTSDVPARAPVDVP